MHQGFRFRILYLQAFQAEIQLHLAIQLHELTRQFDLGPIVDQGLTAFGLFDFLGAIQEAGEIAKFIDQKRRGFHANPRRAGHVVDAVTGERLNVHNSIRADSEFLNHPVAVDAFVFHCVEHLNAITDKLHEVFVRADNGTAPARVACLTGEGRDDVVGLKAFDLFASDIESTRGVACQRELRAQILGRGRAVGFVEIVEVVAEALAGMVKDHRHMGRRIWPRVALNIAVQHVAEASDRANRQSVGFPRQRRQCVIGAKDKGRAVD